MSKDEVKAAHSDFDRCPRGGGLRTVLALNSNFFERRSTYAQQKEDVSC